MRIRVEDRVHAASLGSFKPLLSVRPSQLELTMAVNTGALRWLRNNSTSSEVLDHELEGQIANVSLPISTEHRGKIILTKAGAREQMTAAPVDGSTIDSGKRVVIVRVEGGVALVTPLGPDLELE